MQTYDAGSPANLEFDIGRPVRRKEDEHLVTGRGRFTDDVTLPGQAFASVLRSPHAHGLLCGIEPSAALAMPGVLAVYTAIDMERAGYGPLRCTLPLKNVDGSPLFAPPRPLLATGRVRYVGEPLALVVALSPEAARDALERIELRIERLAAVTDIEQAVRNDAPSLFEGHGNVCLDWRFGDVEATERAFAQADHVTRLEIVSNRVVVAPMEPRAAVAAYDAGTARFTLHVGCQGVFGLRRALAEDILNIEPKQLRVITGNVGGSFGMKAPPYPEYVALLHAARELGRPVKWSDQRSESFVSDQQGRATVIEGELALDGDGNILAVRVRSLADMGAYLTTFGPMMPTVNMQKNLPSLYRDTADRDRDPLRVHQHRADRPVPRRGAAGGELRHGAADRRRRARDRARPGRAAAA